MQPSIDILCGDSLEILKELPSNFVDSMVTDPPAGISFMGKDWDSDKGADNTHPTVKSTALMAYLIRLVTPPGGLVFDPFMGSGSTGVVCSSKGFGFLGIELNPEYFEIANRRIFGGGLLEISSDPATSNAAVGDQS